MSLAGSQQNILLALLARLRPHWRHDRTLPGRIRALLASDRRFGSRDRRLYRELIYTTLRYLPWIEPELERDPVRAVAVIAWLSADAPATARFRAALAGDWPVCPPTLTAKSAVLREKHAGVAAAPAGSASDAAAFDPAALLPAWFRSHCPKAFDAAQLDALLARAPLWLRLQTDAPAPVLAEFEVHGWRVTPAPAFSSALLLHDEADVTRTHAYELGLVEIQDLGSQLLLASAGVQPGGRWLDACAGAGGKTLQLAALLGPAGRIDAHDVRRAALDELFLRARRAGLPVKRTSDASGASPGISEPKPTAAAGIVRGAAIRLVNAVEESDYDGVLVDAPCSGSGTWRRAPHLKWTTTTTHVEQAARQQRELLDALCGRVRAGGVLVYATCSLSRRENQDVVAAFLGAHREFTAEPPARSFGGQVDEFGLTLLPALHDTDGFFVSCLRRL